MSHPEQRTGLGMMTRVVQRGKAERPSRHLACEYFRPPLPHTTPLHPPFHPFSSFLSSFPSLAALLSSHFRSVHFGLSSSTSVQSLAHFNLPLCPPSPPSPPFLPFSFLSADTLHVRVLLQESVSFHVSCLHLHACDVCREEAAGTCSMR
eukprot:6178136-Pleurochrysis_carterae.AAC.1